MRIVRRIRALAARARFPRRAACALAAAASSLLLVSCQGGCATAIRPDAEHYQAPFEKKMVVTGYCNCQSCCGWKRNWYGKPVIASGKSKGKRKMVGVTASGARAHDGTIAADTSFYPFGTIFYIPGYGYGQVEDRGGAIKGQHIDAWFRSHTRARIWGKQNLTVKVWLPKTAKKPAPQQTKPAQVKPAPQQTKPAPQQLRPLPQQARPAQPKPAQPQSRPAPQQARPAQPKPAQPQPRPAPQPGK